MVVGVTVELYHSHSLTPAGCFAWKPAGFFVMTRAAPGAYFRSGGICANASGVARDLISCIASPCVVAQPGIMLACGRLPSG